MRARYLLSLALLAGALISSCLGSSGGGGTGRVLISGQDAGAQVDGGQGATGTASLASCRPCARASQCASQFCNRLDGSDEGRCSEPGDVGVCNCDEGVLVNGQVCTGSDCPAGEAVLLNCEQLTGEAVAIVAALPGEGGAGGASGGASGNGGSVTGGGGGVGGASGSGGVGGSGGAGGASPNASAIGAPCASDAECGVGLICLEADGTDWFAGGPSNGYCTLSCANDATACDPFGALCISGATVDESFCFEACQRGQFAKCHDRPDTACFQVGAASAACLPTCGSDSQCPIGAFCDIVGGVCVAAQPVGDPIGTPCTLANDTCEGFCQDFGNGLTQCTGFCTVGLEYPGCGIEPANASAGDPVCLPLFADTDAVGDTGLCVQRCDCNDQCLHPANVCMAFDDAVSEEAFSALGLCAEDDLVSPNLACNVADGGS